MNNSWDNSGSSRQKGRWKYRETLFTVSIVLFCVLGAGAIGVLWFSHNQAGILEVERERAKPDWAAAALVVEGMRTEDGAKAIYQANPKLTTRFKNEKDFLDFAAQWRPHLDPLPKDVPRTEEKNFGHRHGYGMGPTILSYKMPSGCWVIFNWSGPYNSPSRQLTNLECNQ